MNTEILILKLMKKYVDEDGEDVVYEDVVYENVVEWVDDVNDD